MPASTEARSPYTLLDEVERARDVLVLTYTASLEFFERFALSDARALGALVTVVSDAAMVRADPVVVRRAGVQYLDARAVCPGQAAFHPKLLVIVGDGNARVAVGSGNLTMAGWHSNAETWTMLRADQNGGPETLRDVASFLSSLAESEVTLSAGAPDALRRVAAELNEFPADRPGPRLLHSLSQPILDQLPSPVDPVEDLMIYSPFYDSQLTATRALLDGLAPRRWTAFVQPDTLVDGPALQLLADERSGRVAWVARNPTDANGVAFRDERYWHGKVAQWRTSSGETWAMTGSPNLSRPALLASVGSGGNCELALVARLTSDLTPQEGQAPSGGLNQLEKPGTASGRHSGPILLSAQALQGAVTIELHQQLPTDGMFERYDVVADRWTASAKVSSGERLYTVDVAAAPIGQALRLRAADTLSNEVFVSDPERLRRRQQKAIGAVRRAPDEVVRLGLEMQLLNDIDELRPHLLAVGATGIVTRPAATDEGDDEDSELPVARPASGLTLEEFLEACDPVLGRRMTEFALVLPALPGVGAALDAEVGTLDSDDDETATDGDDEADGARGGRSIHEELNERAPNERRRYKRFVERLVDRAANYPMLVRTLTLRTLLHSIAAGLWPGDEWASVLATALRTLGAVDDESRPEVELAASSLASISLALLRSDVPKMSFRDERQMRYVDAATAVTELLQKRDQQQIELLSAELDGRLPGPVNPATVEATAAEALSPQRGADRAVRLLREERDIAAHATGDATIGIDEPLAGLPEPTLILALRLADETGPVFAVGATPEGRAVRAAWCAPWLAVERVGKTGMTYGRAWRLVNGQTLHAFDLLAELPRADVSWAAGEDPAEAVKDLLTWAADDAADG